MMIFEPHEAYTIHGAYLSICVCIISYDGEQKKEQLYKLNVSISHPDDSPKKIMDTWHGGRILRTILPGRSMARNRF